MDGDQRIGGPGRRPAAQQGRQGSPFPAAGPDATQAYPGPFGPGAGPQARDQYGRDQYGRDQYGRDQYGRDQFGRDHEGQYPLGQYPQDQYPPNHFGRDEYGAGQYQREQFPQDQYGQNQYGPSAQGPGPFGPDDPGSGGSGGPSRRVVLITLALAALLAAGVGTIFAVTRSDTTTTATTMPSVSLTTPAATTPSVSASTPAKTVTVTKTPSTTATIAGTLPTGYVSDPWNNPGMEFGTLTSVKKQGSGAVITIKRQQFLTGTAAADYYAAHPGEDPMDYKILDLGKSRTLTVAQDALVYGQYLLGDQNQVTTSQLTTAQFVGKAKDLQSKSLPLHLWLYQRTTTSGPVVYLAEQYTP
jgi:hypothetical protein